MIRTDVELGDFRNNPTRVGGFSRQLKQGGIWEMGFAVRMPISRFHLGAVVAMQIDSRTLVGEVVFAQEAKVNVSGVEYVVSRVKLEGRFV